MKGVGQWEDLSPTQRKVTRQRLIRLLKTHRSLLADAQKALERAPKSKDPTIKAVRRSLHKEVEHHALLVKGLSALLNIAKA